MWPISPAAQALLTSAVQTYSAKADILSPAGVVLATLDVAAGSVTVDTTASQRRTINGLQLVDAAGALVPRTAKALLDPRAGNEVRVWRGIVNPYDENTTEWVPTGTFRVSQPTINEDPSTGVVITMGGADRSRTVQLAAWTDTYTAAGWAGAATAALLTNRMPGLPVTVVGPDDAHITNAVFGLNQSGSSDPWTDAQTLAAQGGMRCRIDPMGACFIEPIPVPSATPVFATFDEANPDCTVTAWSRDLDDTGTYNGAIVQAQSTIDQTSLTGTAWDTDPNSPTYYLGPFGKRPKIITLDGIATQADADNAALAQLQKLTGLAEQVQITATPNPALDADDVVTLQRQRIGLSPSGHVIQTINLPVTTGTMTLTCRRRY